MQEMSFVELAPDAHLLLSSLRSVGYRPETAIADIVDNCITAGADMVKVNFIWNGRESKIIICDNGIGMDQEKLIKSMKIGSSSPKDYRAKNDLGRFGMGMKTAAFSMGKQLNVVTKINNQYSNACWDLSFIEKDASGLWKLLVSEETKFADYLDDWDHGTAIVVEDLDHIIPEHGSKATKTKNNFYALIDVVLKHLGLVFHRFIEDESLKITINDVPVVAWNPFCLSNSATQELGEEVYCENSKEVIIQPYTLPHKTKFKTEKEFADAEGPYGLTAHQGVYVYRNRRLLVFGTWFGHIRKEPAFNLARIKLDIDAESDYDWKIDIKKSAATPPLYIRDILYRTIDICTETSAKVYNSRGSYSKNVISPNLGYVWEQRKNKNGLYSFHVNKKHPILAGVEKKLDNTGQEDLSAFLALVENYAPFLQSGVVDYLHTSGNEGMAHIDELQKQIDLEELKGYIRSFFNKSYEKDEIVPIILGMANFKYLRTDILKIFEENDYD
ncbi:ATP-binding protein [Anaerosinus massiliensis]|uniref:ATP-binding protein n=1 Tax=Massilibacillus massiliensis TaxID=1806837 RepID=UPI000B08FAAD|nr:ATP-binding protein [Massilibacillus massiliensis]